MKIKSRVNGLIIEATHATSEILKLGNGKFAQAISDSDVASSDDASQTTATKKTPTRKTATKKTTKEEVEQVKAEAKAKGIKLTDAQIKGGNVHDDTATSEDAVEKL